MLTNYQYLKYRLQKHYEGKSQLKKYLEELKNSKHINDDLKALDLNKDCQYIQKLNNDKDYVLRIVEYGEERYRIWFSENGIIESYIYDNFGYSDVWGYRVCGRRMGWHQEDHIWLVNAPIVNETNLFPYIDLSKLRKTNAAYLIRNILKNQKQMYALELLIKSGRIRLAEEYIKNSFGDIKKALKYNSKLLEKPNEKRLLLAYRLGEKEYRRGMLSYMSSYYVDVVNKVKKGQWDKVHNYIKQQEKIDSSRSRVDMLRDYSDYLEHNEQFGLPKYPKNLYEAKGIVRERFNQLRVLEDKKKARKFKKQFEKRYKEVSAISNDNFIVRLPKEPDELIDEGKVLHHCVGQYYQNHASNDTTIAFVRDKNKDEPFITVEIKNNRIEQMRGMRNKTDMITKEHKNLVNQMILELKGAKQCQNLQ